MDLEKSENEAESIDQDASQANIRWVGFSELTTFLKIGWGTIYISTILVQAHCNFKFKNSSKRNAQLNSAEMSTLNSKSTSKRKSSNQCVSNMY